MKLSEPIPQSTVDKWATAVVVVGLLLTAGSLIASAITGRLLILPLAFGLCIWLWADRIGNHHLLKWTLLKRNRPSGPPASASDFDRDDSG